jgi:hypothetical protein
MPIVYRVVGKDARPNTNGRLLSTHCLGERPHGF